MDHRRQPAVRGRGRGHRRRHAGTGQVRGQHPGPGPGPGQVRRQSRSSRCGRTGPRDQHARRRPTGHGQMPGGQPAQCPGPSGHQHRPRRTGRPGLPGPGAVRAREGACGADQPPTVQLTIPDRHLRLPGPGRRRQQHRSFPGRVPGEEVRFRVLGGQVSQDHPARVLRLHRPDQPPHSRPGQPADQIPGPGRHRIPGQDHQPRPGRRTRQPLLHPGEHLPSQDLRQHPGIISRVIPLTGRSLTGRPTAVRAIRSGTGAPPLTAMASAARSA